MRIQIESKASGGLKVIGEIPSLSPCLLEGQNGVGKTVAVQLLQLIAGGQPFEDPRLWTSLRERIGNTSVHITDLSGAKSLRFEFTPEQWPDLPTSLTSEDLGTAAIDDSQVTAAEAASLLSVVRIAGNEDIVRTLTSRVETIKNCLAATRERIGEGRGQVADLLDEIVAEVTRADPSQVTAEKVRLATAEEQLEGATESASLARRREAELHRAVEAKERVGALANPTNALLIRREELIRSRSDLIGERDELEKSVEEMGAELTKRGDPQGALVDAQRILRHRLKRLARLEDEQLSAAARLEVDLSREAIQAAFESAKIERENLEQERREFGGTGAVRDLLEDIRPLLDEAANDASVADQVLLQNASVTLTVADVAALATAREKTLTENQSPGELERIERELQSAISRIDLLHQSATNLDDLEKQRKSVESAREDEKKAEKAAEKQGDVDVQYREANQKLGAIQEQIDSLTGELATVSKELGSLGNVSIEDATKALTRALNDLDANEADLAELNALLPQETQRLDADVARIRQEVGGLRRSVKVKVREIEIVARRMFSDADLAWLHQLVGEKDENISGRDEDQLMERYVAFRKLLLDTHGRVGAATELVENLLGIAANLDLSLGNDGDRLGQRYRNEFVEAIGIHLRNALNTASIRRALFDDAEISNVDPVARELTLKTAGGSVIRPLAAFSTGEQAFAYTQARILDLPPSESPNRLLFLDEFGAFVAADRLPALAEFLGGEQVQRSVDQVIVILPLHVDYEREIDETTGELRKQYTERLKQIKKRGYCAVELRS